MSTDLPEGALGTGILGDEVLGAPDAAQDQELLPAHFNNSAAYTTEDQVGSNDLTVSGAVQGTGQSNFGLQLDGTDDWALIPDAAIPTWYSNQSYSVSVWFKTAASGGIYGHTNNVDPTGTPTGYVPALYIDSSGNLRSSLVWRGATTTTLSGVGDLRDDGWHLATAVWDDAAGTETLYVDGSQADQDTSLGETDYASGNYAYILGANYGPSWPSHPGGWAYFNGVLDDFRVYNTALSSTDVANLYAGQNVTSGLVAHYPFEVGANQFYSPTVTASYTLTPSLYSDADTFFSATVTTSYTLTPSLFSDGDTFFDPTVTTSYTLSPSLYSDADTFFSPTVTASYTLTPSLFDDSTDTFFSPTVAASYTLQPSPFSDADTFFSATVAHADTELLPSLVSDGDTFFSATVTTANTLQPSLYSDADTFFSPTVASSYTLTPSLYSDADNFYDPTVTTANTLTPSLYVDGDTFYSATVTPGEVTLTPSLYSDADTFFTPTVTTSYTLTPSLYSDADTFFSATITTSYTLTPSLYSDADTFHSATVTPGEVSLQPSLYSDDDTFFSPTVAATYTLTPSLFTDGDTFFDPTVTTAYTLTPSLYTDADTFFSPTVTPGEVTLQPSLFSDDDVFFTPVVTPLTTIQPDADLSDGNWVNEAGSNVDLYASVDEASPNDSDYIRSGNSPSADIVRLRLSNHDATPNEPYHVRYRYERGGTLVGGTLQLKARLLQGGTTIAEWTHNNIGTSFVDADQTLSHGEFVAISDFTDLNVEFEATYAA